MVLKRTSIAEWGGASTAGKGILSTGSKLIENGQYSFPSRFEQATGTNPEELIAAAFAGCYSMALSFILDMDAIKSEIIRTEATLSMEVGPGNVEITGVHLQVTGAVPGIDQALFYTYAEKARTSCAVSRILRIPISLEAVLR
ncbi:OsmC family peroxiredoxin [Paradesertivirga mongoliensis]|uniref:OsmC family peroxiredoxin n=1 Tax=Paradesertivirga mongoliensis TaxID=2100740 RepID=A0ABW4ZQX0_9SPHI|nr:OsmC family peroxiredoxin [Pedobacter mongoliensis]